MKERTLTFARTVQALCLLLLHVWTLGSFASAELPVARLQSIQPCAVQQGSRTEIETFGEDLARLEEFIASSDLVQGSAIYESRALKDFLDATGRFQLDVKQAMPPGLATVRFRGQYGLTNPRPLLVTQREVRHIKDDIADRSLAVQLEPKTVFVHEYRARQKAFYDVVIKKGEEFEVVAYATQLDSKAIPTLVLLDVHGGTVERSRAMGRWPARVHCATPGQYTLVSHDFLYRGGSDFHYLLEGRVGELGRVGNLSKLPPLELDQLLSPRLPTDVDQLHQHIATKLFNPASVMATSFFAPQSGTQPSAETIQTLAPYDNKPASQQTSPIVRAPFAFRGSLGGADASFIFEAKKDIPLQFSVFSEQLDQLTDPHVTLYRLPHGEPPIDFSKRSRVFEQDDALLIGGPGMPLRLRDPLLTWSPPADGVYMASIKDHQRGERPSGAGQCLINVEPAVPSFRLLASPIYPHSDLSVSKPAGSLVRKGGTIVYRIQAIRSGGFRGPIEIRASELPPGVESKHALMLPGMKETAIVLQASDKIQDWMGPVRFIGEGTHAGKQIASEAESAIVCQEKTAYRTAPQVRRSTQLMLCTDAKKAAPIRVQFGKLADTSQDIERGGTLKVPVSITRADAFKVGVILRGRNLPAGISMPDVTVPADKDKATIELKVSANAELGEFTTWLQCEVKLNWPTDAEEILQEQNYLAALKVALKDQLAQKPSLTPNLKEAVTKQEAKLQQLLKATNRTAWIPSNLTRIRILEKKPAK